MTIRINGKKDPDRRKAIEKHGTVDIPIMVGDDSVNLQMWPQAFRKTALTYALPMAEPFIVDTLEGVHEGKAGDYLAIGAAGEMYPIDAAVFAATYEAVEFNAGTAVKIEDRVERMKRGEFG